MSAIQKFRNIDQFPELGTLGGGRRFRRSPVRLNAEMVVDGQPVLGQTADISMAGLFFVTDTLIDAESVKLRVQLPDGQLFSVDAHIRRRRPVEVLQMIPGRGMELTLPGYGVEFGDLAPEVASELGCLVGER